MWTHPNSLYVYRSPSNPAFTFYYLPLPKYQQKKYRRTHSEYLDTYNFMADLLSDRLILVEETVGMEDYVYDWPDDEDIQDHLLGRFGDEIVFELGAVILGWMRSEDEDPDVFMSRITDSLVSTSR